LEKIFRHKSAKNLIGQIWENLKKVYNALKNLRANTHVHSRFSIDHFRHFLHFV